MNPFPQVAGVHPPHVKQAALGLIAAGHNYCEVSRMLGIPRRTILGWRRPTYKSRRDYSLVTCPRCWRSAKPMRFSHSQRGIWSVRINRRQSVALMQRHIGLKC